MPRRAGLGAGGAGSWPVQCFCWLLRGKPRTPAIGDKQKVARPNSARVQELPEPARTGTGVGRACVSSRDAQGDRPRLPGVSHHHSALDPPPSPSAPCLWLPAWLRPRRCISGSRCVGRRFVFRRICFIYLFRVPLHGFVVTAVLEAPACTRACGGSECFVCVVR